MILEAGVKWRRTAPLSGGLSNSTRPIPTGPIGAPCSLVPAHGYNPPPQGDAAFSAGSGFLSVAGLALGT